jgi:uncharacterized protein (UPF0297 family)
MSYIRIVNPNTGEVIMEEYQDGTIKVLSNEMKKLLESVSGDSGRIPTKEELEELVRKIEEGELVEELAVEKVVPYKGGPVIDSDIWDASAARKRMAKWASSDGSGKKEKMNWGKFSQGFLIIDGDPENFGSYKYPHHDVRNNELCVHKKGTIAAMAFLLKVRPSGVEAAYDHMAKHYRAMDMEPPKLKNEAYTDEEMVMHFGEDWRQLIAMVV